MEERTAEQVVKDEYPAYVQWSHVTHEYVVWSGAVSLETRLGWGFSTAEAWLDAAQRIQQSQLAEARSQIEHANVMWQGSERQCNLLQKLLDDEREKYAALEAQLADYGKVVEVSRCIRHWHDASNDGMIVSAQHVHALWEALANLERTQSRQPMSERSAGE